MEECNLDVKQLFFNNLQLLGFDVVAMEATNHIPFNKNMFELSNKRGAEIVLHFLFERLNPTMSREAFRDVWPILDKKREQAFRKTCANWLGNIAKEEPESHLPRINASLFMSPGGDKFYDLLMCFSGHVLMKVMDSELVCAYSKPVDRLKFPTLTPSNTHLGDVMVKELACSSIQHRKNFFNGAQLTLKAGGTWKDTADEFVKEFRKLNKEIRELDYNIREEEQRSVENSLNRGSPTKKYGKLDNLDPTFDPRIIQRAQRVHQVREMWKQLDDFERTEAAEREIVESIVERTINKYKIDATEIAVQVPDMLLRECGEEIRRRNVANTYQGGKLNLESVLQLWNLCLHLYLEKLKQVGMPQFNDDVKKLTSQVHVQQNYLQSARTLRNQMSEKVPVLKESIDKLREELDEKMFKDKSPSSIRSTVSDPVVVSCERTGPSSSLCTVIPTSYRASVMSRASVEKNSRVNPHGLHIRHKPDRQLPEGSRRQHSQSTERSISKIKSDENCYKFPKSKLKQNVVECSNLDHGYRNFTQISNEPSLHASKGCKFVKTCEEEMQPNMGIPASFETSAPSVSKQTRTLSLSKEYEDAGGNVKNYDITAKNRKHFDPKSFEESNDCYECKTVCVCGNTCMSSKNSLFHQDETCSIKGSRINKKNKENSVTSDTLSSYEHDLKHLDDFENELRSVHLDPECMINDENGVNGFIHVKTTQPVGFLVNEDIDDCDVAGSDMHEKTRSMDDLVNTHYDERNISANCLTCSGEGSLVDTDCVGFIDTSILSASSGYHSKQSGTPQSVNTFSVFGIKEITAGNLMDKTTIDFCESANYSDKTTIILPEFANKHIIKDRHCNVSGDMVFEGFQMTTVASLPQKNTPVGREGFMLLKDIPVEYPKQVVHKLKDMFVDNHYVNYGSQLGKENGCLALPPFKDVPEAIGPESDSDTTCIHEVSVSNRNITKQNAPGKQYAVVKDMSTNTIDIPESPILSPGHSWKQARYAYKGVDEYDLDRDIITIQCESLTEFERSQIHTKPSQVDTPETNVKEMQLDTPKKNTQRLQAGTCQKSITVDQAAESKPEFKAMSSDNHPTFTQTVQADTPQTYSRQADRTQINSKTVVADRTQINSKTVVADRTQINSKTVVADRTQINSKTVVADRTQINSKTVVADRTQINSKTVVADRTQINSKTVVADRTQTDTKALLVDKLQMVTNMMQEENFQTKTKLAQIDKPQSNPIPTQANRGQSYDKPVNSTKRSSNTLVLDKAKPHPEQTSDKTIKRLDRVLTSHEDRSCLADVAINSPSCGNTSSMNKSRKLAMGQLTGSAIPDNPIGVWERIRFRSETRKEKAAMYPSHGTKTELPCENDLFSVTLSETVNRHQLSLSDENTVPSRPSLRQEDSYPGTRCVKKSLGFGLVEPSPQPNFSPGAVITPTQPLEVPRFSGYVDTPEAANQIREEMRASVVHGPKQLFTDDVDLLSQQGPKDSGIPRPDLTKGPSQTSSRQSSRPMSARSTTSSKGSKRSNHSSARPVQDAKHPRNKEPVFPTVSSPRTMVEKSYKDDKNLDLSTDSMPLSARSNISSTGRSDRSGNSSSTAKASQSPRSLKSNSPGRLSARSHDSERGGQHGRKTPTDLLVDEIMGEGKILSPFNSGLEAFESRVLVNRTPELEEANKENMEPDVGDTEVLNNQVLCDTPDTEPVDEDQMDINDIYTNKGKQFTDYGTDGVEFEEILGPVLDEEYDNNDCLSDGSRHSEGPVVVIDRSLHLSPKHTPEKQQRSDDTKFIDDEKFPSLETSPCEAIVIDHSFQKSPISKDNKRNRNHSNNIPEFLSQSYQGQTVDSDQVKKDLLSKSLLLERSPLMEEIREMFQKAVAETPPRGRSLTNQQPDSRGYRRKIDTSAQQTDGFVDKMDDDDVLDLPDMDINSRHSGRSTGPCVKANTSWEMTENLDDIQMPDFDEPSGLDNAGDNDDVDYNDSADHDRELRKECDGSDNDTEGNQGFSIPGVVEIDDIDDFFRTKTPELPSRYQEKTTRSQDMDATDRSVDMPDFPDNSMEEELPLISFTS